MKKCLWMVMIGALLLTGPAKAAQKIPPIQLPSSLVNFFQVGRLLLLERTRYEGRLWYYPVLKSYPDQRSKTLRVFWWGRVRGQILADDAYFFPNLWTNNTDITALMADIGVPTNRTYSSAEMWDRMNRIWYWMAHNTATDGDTYSSGDHYPSIADMAWVFQRDGVIQRGACNSTAQLMATLMARAGIPVNRIAMAHAHYGPTASHVYVILLLPEGWHYLDATDGPSADQLPPYADRTSFGLHADCDYIHPFEVNILPRSDLNSVPLCLEAD